MSVEASNRKRLEQLCRYITRPGRSDERVQLNDVGQVELKLKTPWRDETMHLLMTPLELMQRLAAPVPQQRLDRTGQPDSGRAPATLDGRGCEFALPQGSGHSALGSAPLPQPPGQ